MQTKSFAFLRSRRVMLSDNNNAMNLFSSTMPPLLCKLQASFFTILVIWPFNTTKARTEATLARPSVRLRPFEMTSSGAVVIVSASLIQSALFVLVLFFHHSVKIPAVSFIIQFVIK